MAETTIKIYVKYISYLKKITGCDAEAITVSSGATLSDLIYSLAKKYSTEITSYFINQETGDLWPGIAVAHNSCLVGSFKEASPLKDGDEIILLISAQGG